MQSLISINHKFMVISPKDLIELINQSKYIRGVEAYIDINNQEELDYLEHLMYEIYKNNMILQIHADIEADIDKQIQYMHILESFYTYLSYDIKVTFHSKLNDNKESSINETIDYLTRLINEINDHDKITICLENLNNDLKQVRLNREDITKSVLNDEMIYFTYDVGHELADFGNLINLDKYLFDDIRNIHIHSNKNGIDHYPIYKDDEHLEEINKVIEYLKVNHYLYNIVYEYDVYACNGNTLEEQIMDYIKSIDLISEKYYLY